MQEFRPPWPVCGRCAEPATATRGWLVECVGGDLLCRACVVATMAICVGCCVAGEECPSCVAWSRWEASRSGPRVAVGWCSVALDGALVVRFAGSRSVAERVAVGLGDDDQRGRLLAEVGCG